LAASTLAISTKAIILLTEASTEADDTAHTSWH
jgi:hypothetical protein